MARSARGAQARIERLGRRIEKWRRTRERRTRMPAELWSEAVDLAQAEGAYPIARAVRIDFAGLKRRVAEAAIADASAPPSGFVELSGAQVPGASASAGAVVEVSDEAGMRLVVRLAREADLDVGELVRIFRQGGA